MPKEIDDWIKLLPEASAEGFESPNDCEQVDWQEYQWYQVPDDHGQISGKVGIATKGDVERMLFIVSKEERNKRIEQVLSVIKNGFMIHSSTEEYGMVPMFIVIGLLKVPVPVFNSAIQIKEGKIQSNPLNQVLNNEYVERAWYDSILPLDDGLMTSETSSTGSNDNVFHPLSSISDIMKTLA
jgi:CRISPR-associated protein Cst2